jgi:NAD(P) transhydrogenase
VDAEYDLVVIGGGPAGERGAAQAAYFGKRVAIVERRPDPGGAAVHTGTLPSKTLRETGLFLSGYRQRDLYGVKIEVEPDMAVARLLERKNAVAKLEIERIYRNLRRHGIDLVRGTGRLMDGHAVEVVASERIRSLRAEVVLVATGSSPYRPLGVPYDDPGVHDADTILAIDRLPRSLAVIGGGVVGCEYACMFAALGSEVHIVDPRPRLLPFLDAEIVDRLATSMSALGISLHLSSRFTGVERATAGLATSMEGDRERITTEAVLVAAGRVGNTRELGLAPAGIEVSDRGYVVVDDDFRTTVGSVYAAGDVIGFPALASVSMDQARVAVCHAFGFTYKRQLADLLPYGVYTIPEVSCVGLAEEEAARRGVDVVVGRASFADNVRGQIVGDRDGMVKLLFDRSTRRLVGCHCIGERASELVHIGQAIITLGGTAETFIEMVFNHPTLGEAFKYAAYDALGGLGPTPETLA